MRDPKYAPVFLFAIVLGDIASTSIANPTLTDLATVPYPIVQNLVVDTAGNVYGAANSSVFELSGQNHQTLTTLLTGLGEPSQVISGQCGKSVWDQRHSAGRKRFRIVRAEPPDPNRFWRVSHPAHPTVTIRPTSLLTARATYTERHHRLQARPPKRQYSNSPAGLYKHLLLIRCNQSTSTPAAWYRTAAAIFSQRPPPEIRVPRKR